MFSTCDFEAILNDVGGFGRYQMYMYVWHILNLLFLGPHLLFMVFGGIVPQIRGINNDTRAFNDSFNFTHLSDNDTQPQFYSALAEWQLVGDLKQIGAFLTSVQMIGVLFGPMSIGLISDRCGRKPAYFASFCGLVLSGLMSAFCTNWKMFAVARFFIGFAVGALIAVEYVLVLEIMPARSRAVLYFLGWPFSFVWLGLLARFTMTWRLLTLVMHSPVPAIVLGSFWVYESPKWLLERGLQKRATDILAKIAHRNGIRLPNLSFLQDNELSIALEKPTPVKTYTYLDIFYSKQASIRSVVLLYSWFATSMASYGLVFNMGNLVGDITLNFIIVMSLRILSNSLIPILDRYLPCFGRRALHQIGLCGMTLSTLLSLEEVLNPAAEDRPYVLTIASMVSLVFCSFMWSACELYSAELFPTLLRNMGNGMCNTVARIGSIVAPYVVLLRFLWAPALYLLLAIILLLNMVLALFLLPETKGKPLPDMPVRDIRTLKQSSIANV